MVTELIEGVYFIPQDPIRTTGGSVMHCIKELDSGLETFGEAYFSTTFAGQAKAWRKHKRMNCNLFLPYGEVLFVFYDDRKESQDFGKIVEFLFSAKNYGRLIINPGIWFGFCGTEQSGESILLNIASIAHDPLEYDRLEPDSPEIPYNWKFNQSQGI